MPTALPSRLRFRTSPPPDAPSALPAGTVVLTLGGARPVEYLAPGDRIVTRAGARPLRQIRLDPGLGHGFRPGFDAPEVIRADGREVGTVPPC